MELTAHEIQMIEFWKLIGTAFLPFVISVIYICTKCGTKRIPWFLDIVAFALSIATFPLLRPIIDEKFHLVANLKSIGMILSCVITYVAIAIELPIVYTILYSMSFPAPKQPVVETAPAHGHGHDAHGHGGHGHGGGAHH